MGLFQYGREKKIKAIDVSKNTKSPSGTARFDLKK